ncbi:MAG: biotin/lipoyl-binding protein [Caldithrix sp.]|nr:biotin/lipoyl-binding protein [Caldithrix sp.]
MIYEMVMPKMGESITEATVVKWLKNVGDELDKDEIILEISTDKVDSEIPTPVPGTVTELLANEGDTVEVGETIAKIETEDKAAAEAQEQSGESQKEPVAETEEAPVKEPVSRDDDKEREARPGKSRNNGNRFYSPVVLNIANENDIGMDELGKIPGSGLNNRVTKKDLLAYLSKRTADQPEEKAPPAPAAAGEPKTTADGPVELMAMDHVRKKIADHMIQSTQTSAHVSLYTEVDMQTIYRIRERHKKAFKQREGFSLTYMPFITDAVVKALKEFPMVNAQIDSENIILKKYYNIGIAVAVDDKLMVPNLFKADEKNLLGLARSINDLAVRTRNKQLKPDELSGGTFSISNFGVFGTTVGFPIINQPQVAILGVGSVKKRPVVINDAIAIRPIMYLSLTIDHRLIDGAMGSQFLERIRELLEYYDDDTVL